MKNFIFSGLLLAALISIEGCAVQNHATTVERDKDNACAVRVVMQIGIDGTDSDVIAVREQLEPCYDKVCIIPCTNDNSNGCKVTMTVVIKKWSSLSAEEQKNFHHVTMVPNDGLPSNAQIGKAGGPSGVGTWRRNEPPRTYCHEVLHFAGLPDEYCSRVYDTINHTSVVEVICKTPPDPDGGNCCTATPQQKRCGQPCPGHEHDIMATLEPELTCNNILDVVKKAGLDNCPAECCKNPRTSYNFPKYQIFIGPSYTHFGDKDFHYNAWGVTGEFIKLITPKIGVTLDVGYYFHKETQGTLRENFQQYNITGGITYWPKLNLDPHLLFSTHALAGISSYRINYTTGNYNSNNNFYHSFNANVGVAMDWKINRSFNIRLLQLDYTPTFFGKTVQNNLRISIGAAYQF